MRSEVKNFIVRQIVNFLKDEGWKNISPAKRELPSIILHHLVRWYPQVAEDGTDCYKKFNKTIAISRISKRAAEQLNALCRQNKDLPITEDKIWQRVHPEHNPPAKVVISKLRALENPTTEEIQNILDHQYQLILITKEERKVLDGSPNKQYPLDGTMVPGASLASRGAFQDRIDAITAELIDHSAHQKIRESFANML